MNVSQINDYRIIRKSVDARKKQVMLNLSVRIAIDDDASLPSVYQPALFEPVCTDAPCVLIVGAGPAGYFAALQSILLGMRPVVLERGRDVDNRRHDIASINRNRKINPESNYCFGEGGAGAFSDGKLYTRSKKRGSVDTVLQWFVQHGAPEEILVDSRPHIGSDRLPAVIREIRHTIERCGGQVMFDTQVEALILENNRVRGVVTSKGDFLGDAIILAIGHSSHDTFRKIYRQGVKMEPKGIAMGVRLEHPQHVIDSIQYHNKEGRGKYLPAAEYSFVTQVDGRGVYSFCMCPGGVIVPAGSSDNELVVNGMSASARSGRWANSGMVVEIRPGDFPDFSRHGDLEMLELQESLEKSMFEAAGSSIVAPAQRMDDFVKNIKSDTLPRSSYVPGLKSADMGNILPPFIAERLRKGFEEFGRKARGFLTNEAVLIGLESRTSSPVRIVREPDTLQSVSTEGLFPAGEGAGYAGGIVSAAVDGMRCADRVNEYLRSKSIKSDNK